VRRKSTAEEFKSDYKEPPLNPRHSSAKKGELSSETLSSIFGSASFSEFFDKSTKMLKKVLLHPDIDEDGSVSKLPSEHKE
jgi:hypothetical protein